MAEFERDPEISRRYRELGAEEPPRALDEAILAASRRRPVRRWAGPVALAAMLVLAVAVTVQIEREKPDAVTQLELKPVPLPSPAPVPAAPAAKVEPEPRAARESRADVAGAPAAQAAPASQLMMRRPAPVASVAQADALERTPERELERIAVLRREQKHEEADKALAEFRKRYPDYKIPDAMRERVEKR